VPKMKRALGFFLRHAFRLRSSPSSSVMSRERRVLVRNLSFFSSAPTSTLRFFSPRIVMAFSAQLMSVHSA